MDFKVEELTRRIETINNLIQSSGFIDRPLFRELEREVKELREKLMALEKDTAISNEKHSSVYIHIDRLDEKMKELEKSIDEKNNRKTDRTEKVFLVVIGGILSFILNKFT